MRLPDMVSAPLHEQITSPLYPQGYPGSARINDNAYLDFSEAISLFTVLQFLSK